MAFFPLTYTAILIWLCMSYTYPSISLRMTGQLLGMITSLSLFGGEFWLNQNPSTGALTVVTVNVTFLDYSLGIVTFASSLIGIVVIAVILFDMRKQKMTFREIFTG